MSRSTPPQAFAYPPPRPTSPDASPNNYYYDEAAEEYVGDYSETEALSDASPRIVATPNVTEIYRRKSAAASTPEHYRQQNSQNIYVPPSYYYETVSPQVLQQMRRAAAPTPFRRAVPVVDERNHYYPPGALENSYRNSVVYSAPQIATVRRSATHATPVTRQVVRRHPITVRTPRYYRRPTLSTVYKKPSTLCLPVACQPDPAVYRRSTRKQSEEPLYATQQLAFTQPTQSRPVIRRHSVPVGVTNIAIDQQKPHPQIYSKELHLSQSDVDAVLARYETILGEQPPTTKKVSSCSSKSSIRAKSAKNKFISNMKPKVPSSIKQKQEEIHKFQETREKQKHRPNSPCNSERLELEEITTEVLDNMLSELMESGCQNRINEKEITEKPQNDAQSISKQSENGDKIVVERPPSGCSDKVESNQYSKSFNYQDIAQNMSKSQHSILLPKPQNNESTAKSVTDSQNSSPVNSPRFDSTTVSNLIQQTSPKLTNYQAVDHNSAMELHRSKSYIVSLIDRALSKELGTIPDRPSSASASRHSRTPSITQGNEHMNARQAINLINKNCNKMDKGLCLEITQALTDSIVSHSACGGKPEANHGTCSCNVQDEPLYVKQLKQLRWGHLKHIQREVRRLEDLERFLDSCSSGSVI